MFTSFACFGWRTKYHSRCNGYTQRGFVYASVSAFLCLPALVHCLCRKIRRALILRAWRAF